MTDQPAANAYSPGERDTRPWGSWEVLGLAPNHVVKRIIVLPGQRLSLQRHQGRHEHWVVVEGTATVTLGDEVRTVQENGSVFIPVRTWHRLENLTEKPLSVIEVQYGNDLREDDIERRDDAYGRT